MSLVTGLDTGILGNRDGIGTVSQSSQVDKGRFPLTDYREEEACQGPWDRAKVLTPHSSDTPLTPGIAHCPTALYLELNENNGYSCPPEPQAEMRALRLKGTPA